MFLTKLSLFMETESTELLPHLFQWTERLKAIKMHYHSHNSTKKKKKPNRKMGRSKETSLQRRNTDGQQVCEKWLNIAN